MFVFAADSRNYFEKQSKFTGHTASDGPTIKRESE